MAFSLARTREFTGEMVEELKKITWPDWPQLKNITFVIIVFVLLVSLIIWLMDISVSGILNLILGLFSAS